MPAPIQPNRPVGVSPDRAYQNSSTDSNRAMGLPARALVMAARQRCGIRLPVALRLASLPLPVALALLMGWDFPLPLAWPLNGASVAAGSPPVNIWKTVIPSA